MSNWLGSLFANISLLIHTYATVYCAESILLMGVTLVMKHINFSMLVTKQWLQLVTSFCIAEKLKYIFINSLVVFSVIAIAS